MSILLKSAAVLRDVVDNDRALEQSLKQHIDDTQENPATIKETVHGGCRYYFLLNAMLSTLLSKPIKPRFRQLHFLLICSLYQIIYMQRPQHAIVNECVNALNTGKLRWAKSLANATLRNFIRNQEQITNHPFSDDERAAFSSYLYQKIVANWPQYATQIITASNQKPPLTLRINQQKTSLQSYAELLDKAGIAFRFNKDSALAISLEKPMPVADIPFFHQGWVSVQDVSSQLITLPLTIAKDETLLDACAAPGGKTCLILEQQPAITMIAVDLAERTPKIQQNLQRLGLNATVITANLLDDVNWQQHAPFDKIILDAPCSGSGVIRRHADIKLRRKVGDIEKFSEQQLALLEQVWPALKTGGTLAYLTCSIFTQENDAVIEKFINNKAEISIKSDYPLPALKTRFGWQRLPGVHDGDGFYYCYLEKA